LAAINALHPNIRITWTISRKSASFLDLDIHFGDRFNTGRCRLDVRIHQKELNRYLYIPALSFHKKSQHRAWIKAELLRLMRNCSCPYEYKRIRSKFFARLLARGYAAKFLAKVFGLQWALHSNRDAYLSTQQKRQDKSYESALTIVHKMTFDRDAYLAIGRIPPSLLEMWMEWRNRIMPDYSSASGTPWPHIEQLLFSEDLIRGARHRTLDQLYPLYTRDAPPPVFSLPLTSASARLTWGQLALTLPPNFQRVPLLVLTRPPALGMKLRFRDPTHDHPEKRRADLYRHDGNAG
jgi:hypothetical protein